MSKKIRIFLLGSQAQVGKDTLANQLVVNEGFTQFSFASKLKNICSDLFQLSYNQVYGDAENKNKVDERYNLSARQILQQFGQSARAIYPDVWASALYSTIEKENGVAFSDNWLNVVVSDFRFPNEYDAGVRWQQEDTDHRQIFAVKIIRHAINDHDYLGKNDISETALNNFQYWSFVLENNDTKEKLYHSFMREQSKLLYPIHNHLNNL